MVNTKLLNSIDKIKYEDTKIIKRLEEILLSKRKKIFSLPKPHTPVVVLMSGGLDSIIMVSFIMEKYKLVIYPLFIRWGQKNLNKEEEALSFFTSYYKKKYPNLFINPKKITALIPVEDLTTGVNDIVVLRNTIFAAHAVHYAHFLQEKKGLKIRTIFCCSVSGDGRVVPDSTLTAIRSTNVNICINEADYSWQYTSIALEKTLGNYKSKSYFVRYAKKMGSPLEKTWSCYEKGNIHCGQCLPCLGRKDAFKKASLEDPTKYKRISLIIRIRSKLLKFSN